jgi:5-formyltetrahydrofolate cyclo-ligase
MLCALPEFSFMAKNKLRQAMLARRKQLGSALCHTLSRQIQQTLIAANCFQQAKSLALYSQVNNEVETGELLEAALRAGKQVCFPRVNGAQLLFCRVLSAAELSPGTFGVAEPPAQQELRVADLDLIVVPGVAFDRAGYRLGYGRGFYDRELARASATTCSVGLCFEFQICPGLPHEAHDRPVNLVVTESQLITCHENLAVSP